MTLKATIAKLRELTTRNADPSETFHGVLDPAAVRAICFARIILERFSALLARLRIEEGKVI